MLDTIRRDDIERLFEFGGGPDVIVAYATSLGTTQLFAARIAATLRATGLAVELCDVAAVDALATCNAVVLGSAVRGGCWLPDAQGFAHDNRGALAERSTWLFSVRHSPLRGRPPRGLRRLRSVIRPRDHRVFSGPGVWSRLLPGRLLSSSRGARLADKRTCREVDAWAQMIAASFTTPRQS